MKDKDYFGLDKIKHAFVCFVAAILSPLFSFGLALGKEYGDSKAVGNHWCNYDLIADVLGLVLGSLIRYFIFGKWINF